jgi:deoxycytidylate deaminase
MTPNTALKLATLAGASSPCAKSKRGVVIFHPCQPLHFHPGVNHPPAPFICDGSPACRAACRDVAVHAEAAAILSARAAGVKFAEGWELLHVKVVDGKAVPSGSPSCIRCSALILEAGVRRVWLLHENGLRSYDPVEFHRLSLEHHGLPAARAKPATREICTDINIAIGEIHATPWGYVMGATPPGGYELRDRALFKVKRGQTLTDDERSILLAIANGLRAL